MMRRILLLAFVFLAMNAYTAIKILKSDGITTLIPPLICLDEYYYVEISDFGTQSLFVYGSDNPDIQYYKLDNTIIPKGSYNSNLSKVKFKLLKPSATNQLKIIVEAHAFEKDPSAIKPSKSVYPLSAKASLANVCQSDAGIDLTTLINENSLFTLDRKFRDSATNEEVYFYIGDLQSYSVGTHTFYSNYVCPSGPVPVRINVLPPPNLGTNIESFEKCKNDAIFNLRTLLSSTDTGGKWYIDSISGVQFKTGDNPQFDPAADKSGKYIYVLSKTGETCAGLGYINIIVNEIKSAGTAKTIAPVCKGGTIDLNSLLTGASAGGTWKNQSGVEVTNQIITTSTLAPGTYSYEYSVPSCGATDTETVSFELLDASINLGDFTVKTEKLCAGTNNVIYTVPADAGLTFDWSYSGTGEELTKNSNSVSVNFSNTATSGNIIVSATSVQCGQSAPVSKQVAVNVVKSPVPVISGNNTVYQNQKGEIYSVVNAAGNTYEWTVTGGTIVGSSTGNQITVDWGNTSSGTLSVKQTITDPGCEGSATMNVTLENSGVLSLSFTSKNITCNGKTDGTATVQPAGGVSPYVISWSTGATSATINALAPGTYTVLVRDKVGNEQNDEVKITEPSVFSASGLLTNNNKCFGESNDEIKLTLSGGTEPYSINWTPSEYNGDTLLSSLPSGDYRVIASDAGKCATLDTIFTVSSFEEIKVSGTTVNPSCGIFPEGSISVSASGGIGKYTYKWQHSSVDSAELLFLYEGSYTVIVSDSLGCNSLAQTFVLKGNDICITIPSAFSPNGDEHNQYWKIDHIEMYPEVVIEIYNRWGQLVYLSKGYNNNWEGTNSNGKALPVDTYHYLISFDSGFKKMGSISIVR